MLEAVELATHSADILIMAAAVSDYRPQSVQNHKMKKGASDSGLTIELVPNPDILKSIDVPGVIRVGFAAETEDLESNARGKLREKSLDLIVANNAQATIGSSTSEATILRKDGTTRKLDRMPKDEVAREVIGEVAKLRKAAE